MADKVIEIAGFGKFLYEDGQTPYAMDTDGGISAENVGIKSLTTNVRNVYSDANKNLKETSTGLAVGKTITSADSPYTAGSEEVVQIDASGGNVTVDLPDASTNNRVILQFKRIDNSNNTVTINAISGQTIDGEGSKDIKYQWSNMVIRSDGTNWFIL